MIPELKSMQDFFASGATLSYAFRRQQLLKLRESVLANELVITQALFKDLGKNAEESWVTETGFLLAEIRHTLKHLKSWMQPQRVPTNLLNLPGRSRILAEPLGMVLIISPWNYPFQLLLTPLVGAIAAGNCAVLKPSEVAPATAAVIQKIVEESFSPEYVRCVQGEGSEVIPPLMNTYRFDHVFYTGSTATGKIIYEMAARNLTPVTLELGGKSPCVIEADANIRVAARRITLAKFSNAGQMCVAPDYLLVHESVKEKLLNELKECADRFYPPTDPDSFGRIVNGKHVNRLKAYFDQGQVLYGGKTDEHNRYVSPTIIEPYHTDSELMQDEIFGPILPILSYRSFEEAVGIISKNKNPLAFYLFTEDRMLEKKWLDAIPFGGGCVNNISWHLTNFNLPFGGRGNSGIGAYHGKFSFDTFSHRKAILKTPTWFDPDFKYPPFKGKLRLFKKLIR